MSTIESKFSPELCDAVERTLRAHNLRLKPEIGLDTVLQTLEANHIKPSVEFGQLTCEQNGLPAHVPMLFEALAKQRTELFFPRQTSAVKSKDQLDRLGKIQFIREQGLSAWENLPPSAPKDEPVVLDSRRMTRSQWLSLDRKTRADLAGKWGAIAVGEIMARK